MTRGATIALFLGSLLTNPTYGVTLDISQPKHTSDRLWEQHWFDLSHRSTFDSGIDLIFQFPKGCRVSSAPDVSIGEDGSTYAKQMSRDYEGPTHNIVHYHYGSSFLLWAINWWFIRPGRFEVDCPAGVDNEVYWKMTGDNGIMGRGLVPANIAGSVASAVVDDQLVLGRVSPSKGASGVLHAQISGALPAYVYIEDNRAKVNRDSRVLQLNTNDIASIDIAGSDWKGPDSLRLVPFEDGWHVTVYPLGPAGKMVESINVGIGIK